MYPTPFPSILLPQRLGELHFIKECYQVLTIKPSRCLVCFNCGFGDGSGLFLPRAAHSIRFSLMNTCVGNIPRPAYVCLRPPSRLFHPFDRSPALLVHFPPAFSCRSPPLAIRATSAFRFCQGGNKRRSCWLLLVSGTVLGVLGVAIIGVFIY